MKIVIFSGGIGNQLFQYCFYKNIQEKFGKRIYIIYKGNNHNGYELEKYFEVNVKNLFSQFFLRVYYRLKRYPNIFGWLYVFEEEEEEEEIVNRKRGLFYIGCWQDKKYLNGGPLIQFKDLILTPQNDAVREKILSSNSVTVHIRRGDYISPYNCHTYWHLENTDYYQNALKYVEKKYEHYSIFVFSDDIEWCKENLSLTDACYIDWNKGNDSIYDMYLMSLSKVNIIANSTFSFWAAYLNRQSEMTIYPLRWYQEGSGLKNPDIFPEGWIGL